MIGLARILLRIAFGTLMTVGVMLGLTVVAILMMHGGGWALLDPKGVVALRERNLMLLATVLMLVVVIPVFVLTFTIAWRYRAGNAKAKYTPDWDRHRWLEAAWWAFPLAIIAVLSVVTWKTSHELDPFRPLESTARPLTIQVVALPWKWLFIYPEQQIATVNMAELPQGRPVDFTITSDAPMNSFWIPQLGGQVYAMSGMTTHLHLLASQVGTYAGSSANLSGEGFAGMKFTAKVTTQAEFERWVGTARQGSRRLSWAEYHALTAPSQNNPVVEYAAVEPGLYDGIVMKYMHPVAP